VDVFNGLIRSVQALAAGDTSQLPILVVAFVVALISMLISEHNQRQRRQRRLQRLRKRNQGQ
jgi:hypothetical protein